jgi:hypothetical protein
MKQTLLKISVFLCLLTLVGIANAQDLQHSFPAKSYVTVNVTPGGTAKVDITPVAPLRASSATGSTCDGTCQPGMDSRVPAQPDKSLAGNFSIKAYVATTCTDSWMQVPLVVDPTNPMRFTYVNPQQGGTGITIVLVDGTSSGDHPGGMTK